MTRVMIQLAEKAPVLYAGVVFVIVASIVLHELGHAWTATWQGDPTPRLRGHLTWDPRVHMGWFSIILVATVGIGFGQTPTNPRYFRDGRRGDAMVSAAGPAVNLLLGIALALSAATLVGEAPSEAADKLFGVLFLASSLNFALCALNMLPIPPLDGFHVLTAMTNWPELVNGLRKAQTVLWVVALVLIWNVGLLDFTDLVTRAIIDAATLLSR